MKKKLLIIIFLAVILLMLLLYLILTSQSVKPTVGLSQPTKSEPVILSDETYKTEVKEIFTSYQKMAINNKFTLGDITDLKNRLLGIKGLPAQFQKLHLNFILALDRMVEYLQSNDGKEKQLSLKMADQLKVEYSWLNN
jgi:hypothetical protein